MRLWNKKTITKSEVSILQSKYGIDMLTSSILIRRGITKGQDIQYFLENDKRFLHNPFLFNNMEDVVDRILQAKEEGEKVLIFGDRDVDGIASTTVLYDYLSSIGIDVKCRLPGGNDPYGLNLDAVNSFAQEFGSLIITVDCGISNNLEIAKCSELGIDVIVLDHHTPPEVLPQGAIIIDPKCSDSGYPFKDISGCAVVYKVVSALRFSCGDLYKQEICLINTSVSEDKVSLTVQKVQNLIKKEQFTCVLDESFSPTTKNKLLNFLKGQQLFVWDLKAVKNVLTQIFGQGIEFYLYDIHQDIAKTIPGTQNISLEQLKNHSRVLRYNSETPDEMDAFFSIFVTYINKVYQNQFPQHSKDEEKDLQLVALAALADIMPLVNENRILVHHGLASINAGHARAGLQELLSHQSLLGKRLSSTDLSWNIVPVLNATGRLGQPELGMELFLEKDSAKRDGIARQIIELNQKRKQLGSDAWMYGQEQAKDSIQKFENKLCVVIDERINRGVSGILAAKLVQTFSVPAMAITFVGETAIGSMRSCRGVNLPVFLDSLGDIFINHGGHTYAAGFSFEKAKLGEFLQRVHEHTNEIVLGKDDSERVEIDAELPAQYLKPDLLNLVDKFEPYGEGNPELVFMSKALPVLDALTMGKTERQHLKLTLDCGSTKWPALFWGEAERLHRDFDKGDKIDILYQINRNTFNGNETPQMILSDLHKV